MRRRKSTPGQRARLYLQAHRDAGYTGLPAQHRESREAIMQQLEREDPHVRERALIGSDQHFDRKLDQGERAHQQHWQRQERLDVGDVTRKRKDLDRETSTPITNKGRRPGAGHRASSVGRGGRRSTITRNTPAPAKELAAFAWEIFVAGIAISLLYLVLTSGEKKGSSGTNVLLDTLTGISGAFRRLADPTNNLFAPATAAASKTAAKTTTTTRTVKRAPAGAPLVGGLQGTAPSFETLTPTIP